jgi:hypothetical protein
MTKQEKVWSLIDAVGEELAIIIQQNDQAEKEAHFEAWFKQEILGRKSTYEPE